jgi:hypothetical protein
LARERKRLVAGAWEKKSNDGLGWKGKAMGRKIDILLNADGSGYAQLPECDIQHLKASK